MLSLLPNLNVTRQMAVFLFWVLLYVLVVGIVEHYVGLPKWFLGGESAAVTAFALGVLVVFRTNTAYERWWEARKQWGQLVNDIRNLALKSRAYVKADQGELRELDRLLIAFPHALRLHLRGVDVLQMVPGFEDDVSQVGHPPGYIAGRVHHMLSHWNREGKLSDTIWILDIHAISLLNICGACERIRNTPLTSSYRSLFRWSILTYVVSAPWVVALDTGLSGFPLLMLGIAFLIGVELTAEAIEEPFGTEGDDLPLDSLCETIERFVLDLELEKND